MGPRKPRQWLVDVAERPDSDVVYLKFVPSASPGLVGRVRVVVAPNTTWTTGRNALYQEAVDIQQQQGWSHEYIIFTDYDTVLAPDDVDVVHRRLSAMQPAVAAISASASDHPRNMCDPWPCSADVDAMFNAFHATAVPIYLPYDATFDNESWWASQSIMIALFMTSAPDYVVEFTDLRFLLKNHHSRYPHGLLKERVLEYLKTKVSSCTLDQYTSPDLVNAIIKAGRGKSCHRCPLTAACLNNTFCESPLETPPRDYGELIQCKPF